MYPCLCFHFVHWFILFTSSVSCFLSDVSWTWYLAQCLVQREGAIHICQMNEFICQMNLWWWSLESQSIQVEFQPSHNLFIEEALIQRQSGPCLFQLLFLTAFSLHCDHLAHASWTWTVPVAKELPPCYCSWPPPSIHSSKFWNVDHVASCLKPPMASPCAEKTQTPLPCLGRSCITGPCLPPARLSHHHFPCGGRYWGRFSVLMWIFTCSFLLILSSEKAAHWPSNHSVTLYTYLISHYRQQNCLPYKCVNLSIIHFNMFVRKFCNFRNMSTWCFLNLVPSTMSGSKGGGNTYLSNEWITQQTGNMLEQGLLKKNLELYGDFLATHPSQQVCLLPSAVVMLHCGVLHCVSRHPLWNPRIVDRPWSSWRTQLKLP